MDGEVIPSQEGTTQGDPLSMAMYSLATIPFIRKLDGTCKQIWYAGSIDQLRSRWNQLSAEGPAANPSKIWLVTQESHFENATNIFAGTGVNVTSRGRPSEQFVEEYAKSKVGSWMSNITLLSEIAKLQPQAASSAGLLSKWTNFSRLIPNISHLLKSLDNAIRSDLIHAWINRHQTTWNATYSPFLPDLVAWEYDCPPKC